MKYEEGVNWLEQEYDVHDRIKYGWHRRALSSSSGAGGGYDLFTFKDDGSRCLGCHSDALDHYVGLQELPYLTVHDYLIAELIVDHWKAPCP